MQSLVTLMLPDSGFEVDPLSQKFLKKLFFDQWWVRADNAVLSRVTQHSEEPGNYLLFDV